MSQYARNNPDSPVSPSYDRFRDPTPQEQREYLICDECNNAQAMHITKSDNKQLCDDCYETYANNSNT